MRRVAAVRLGDHYYILQAQFSCQELPEVRRVRLLVDTECSVTTMYAERLGLSRDAYEALELSEPCSTVGGRIVPRRLHDVVLIFMTVEGEYLPVRLEGCDVIYAVEGALEDGVLGVDVLNLFRRWEGRPDQGLWIFEI